MPKGPADFTILVIDDDPDLRELIATDFVMRGFGVLQAESAATGLERFEHHHVDVVVTDYLMPSAETKGGDTGCELVAKIKERCQATGKPVPRFVLLTGFGDLLPDDARAGMTAVFGKPVDRRALLKLIREQLGLAGDID